MGNINSNTRNEMFARVLALIPNAVSNDLIVNAFELLRKEQKLQNQDYSHNKTPNKTAMEGHKSAISKSKGFIEDQNKYTDMAYGESTVQYSGCEILATYNAMYALTGDASISLPDMISEYERDGMILAGKFGTSPKAAVDFFKKKGMDAYLVTQEDKFDRYGNDYESFILTMYNDKRDISKEVHTICISKSGGKFTAHNVYCNGKTVGPYGSITEVIANINSGKAKGISLIAIRKPLSKR